MARNVQNVNLDLPGVGSLSDDAGAISLQRYFDVVGSVQPEVDEFEAAGLAKATSIVVHPPRVSLAPVAFQPTDWSAVNQKSWSASGSVMEE